MHSNIDTMVIDMATGRIVLQSFWYGFRDAWGTATYSPKFQYHSRDISKRKGMYHHIHFKISIIPILIITSALFNEMVIQDETINIFYGFPTWRACMGDRKMPQEVKSPKDPKNSDVARVIPVMSVSHPIGYTRFTVTPDLYHVKITI